MDRLKDNEDIEKIQLENIVDEKPLYMTPELY